MEEAVASLQSGRNRSPRYYIKVLGKALRALEALRHAGEGGLRLSDVADVAQMDKAAALRILHTLQREGWVFRDLSTKKYKLPLGHRICRVGYAQLRSGDPFSDAVTSGLVEEAKRFAIDLLIADNSLDAEKAVRNAEWMIDQKVDFAIEYQIHYRVAPVLAELFAKARIPTLAIHVPQPGAIYFGPNNYTAGLMAGEALGRFARRKWRKCPDRVLLLESSLAGPNLHARMVGIVRGIRNNLGSVSQSRLAVFRRNSKDSEVLGYEAVTKFLRQLRPRTHLLIGAVSDLSALGAVRAVREAGREAFTAIVGHNFSPDPRVSAEIRAKGSPLVGSLAFFPERYGSRILPAVLRWLNREQVLPAMYADHVMVTKENIDEFCSMEDTSMPAQRVA